MKVLVDGTSVTDWYSSAKMFSQMTFNSLILMKLNGSMAVYFPSGKFLLYIVIFGMRNINFSIVGICPYFY